MWPNGHSCLYKRPQILSLSHTYFCCLPKVALPVVDLVPHGANVKQDHLWVSVNQPSPKHDVHPLLPHRPQACQLKCVTLLRYEVGENRGNSPLFLEEKKGVSIAHTLRHLEVGWLADLHFGSRLLGIVHADAEVVIVTDLSNAARRL